MPSCNERPNALKFATVDSSREIKVSVRGPLFVGTVGIRSRCRLLLAGLGARLREGRAVGMAVLTGFGTVAYSLIDALPTLAPWR